ncbi:conserved hypothetical protein [Culex quinquefasciatus]|uniref:Uncharacterized protein n=1 Tax=Culex quinquefasciatus TaxID=7176 RepID=B0XEX8_CULQU|nr:conserved hypothetical protein [Culex quinquefasciatus]|eukprot:XP_001868200.1 conserved hypothetical protein [Culex quinquefasciatus]
MPRWKTGAEPLTSFFLICVCVCVWERGTRIIHHPSTANWRREEGSLAWLTKVDLVVALTPLTWIIYYLRSTISFHKRVLLVEGAPPDHHHHPACGDHRCISGQAALKASTLRRHYYPEGDWGWVIVLVGMLNMILNHGVQISGPLYLLPAGERFRQSAVNSAVEGDYILAIRINGL